MELEDLYERRIEIEDALIELKIREPKSDDEKRKWKEIKRETKRLIRLMKQLEDMIESKPTEATKQLTDFLADMGKYYQKLIKKYNEFWDFHDREEYTPEAQKIMGEILEERSQEIENSWMSISHKVKDIIGVEHGLGWKVYFVFFILIRLLSLFGSRSTIELIFGVIGLILASTILYSWIWAKHINWLSKLHWLIKLWSIGFFIAPVALIIYGYLFFAKNNAESLWWVVTILLLYPALYVVYRLAWKSPLILNLKKIK